MRAEYQVIIIPYVLENHILKVAIFCRKKLLYWQFVSGGGEDCETLVETAKRELKEEIGLHVNIGKLKKLDAICTIPKHFFKAHKYKEDIYVIPEYSFCVEMNNKNITLSDEHVKYMWVNVKKAFELLLYDSNKTALWELNEKIIDGVL